MDSFIFFYLFIGMPLQLQVVLVLAVFFAGVGGIMVATILKHLDNVVKEYTAYCANIATAVVCYLLFPDRFQFTLFMVLSIGCLLSGIYLYEKKKRCGPLSSSLPSSSSTKS